MRLETVINEVEELGWSESEDLESPDFLTSETLSEEEEDPPEVLDSEDSSTDTDDNIHSHQRDPGQSEATDLAPYPTLGSRSKEDPQQHRQPAADPFIVAK